MDRFRKSTGIIRKSSRRPVWPRPAAEFPVASTVSYNSAFKNRAVYESSKAVSKGYAVRTVTTQSQLLINNAVKKTAASEIQSLSPLNDTGKICLRIPSPPRDEYLLASSTTSDGISADSKIETAENNPASSDEKPSVTENSVASLDESASKAVLTDAKLVSYVNFLFRVLLSCVFLTVRFHKFSESINKLRYSLICLLS